jgi:hypothetical protein
MSLKHSEPNPLAVFNMQRVPFCPPHFQVINFDLRAGEKAILDWIYENVEGRFFLGAKATNGGGAISECAAFENHSEATYFSLFLPTINISSLSF